MKNIKLLVLASMLLSAANCPAADVMKSPEVQTAFTKAAKIKAYKQAFEKNKALAKQLRTYISIDTNLDSLMSPFISLYWPDGQQDGLQAEISDEILASPSKFLRRQNTRHKEMTSLLDRAKKSTTVNKTIKNKAVTIAHDQINHLYHHKIIALLFATGCFEYLAPTNVRQLVHDNIRRCLVKGLVAAGNAALTYPLTTVCTSAAVAAILKHKAIIKAIIGYSKKAKDLATSAAVKNGILAAGGLAIYGFFKQSIPLGVASVAAALGGMYYHFKPTTDNKPTSKHEIALIAATVEETLDAHARRAAAAGANPVAAAAGANPVAAHAPANRGFFRHILRCGR